MDLTGRSHGEKMDLGSGEADPAQERWVRWIPERGSIQARLCGLFFFFFYFINHSGQVNRFSKSFIYRTESTYRTTARK
jgi:hypothetical protein